MDNQHQKIKGYRNLSQEEIDLMNEGKDLEALFNAFTQKVEDHLRLQQEKAEARLRNNDGSELNRIAGANPRRALSIAKTHIETAMMFAIKAVAQPVKQ